ncbi:MAG: hypothetical protein NZT92_15210 [Abditibacteriales bacterium]|nr:hypothetical protein [Abditibacteriales bacterium]MDW8367328.1 hypothetical protein [Abditibacteriales bacterium]
MTNKPIDELTHLEIDRLIENFITRPDDPVIPDAFLSALQEFLQRQATRVVELTAEVIGDQLRFDPAASVAVPGNAFVFGDTRFVVKLRKAR